MKKKNGKRGLTEACRGMEGYDGGEEGEVQERMAR